MEGVKNELDFYSKFARPLIFALPEAKDRVLAASWVKKIKEDENTNEKLKTDYIKLLLFALQRRKLVGIFTDDPTNYESLEEFPDEYDLNAMAQELIETEQRERRSNIRRQLQGQMGDFPPYTTDISSDMREYVAAQDIPCFGVHCYYAISKDPISTWQNADKGILPKAAKSAVNTNSPAPPGSKTPDTCVSCPGPEGTEPCTPGSPAVEPLEVDKKRKKSKKKLGNTPPVKPLVTGPQPEDNDNRKPPTWSSNLIDVIERPRPTTGAIPKVRSEKQIRSERERKGRMGDLDSELEEDYNEIERALKDYQRGEIREQRRKRERRSKADDLDFDESSEDDENDANVEYDFENFIDLNETEYEQELKEDSLLVQYFRDTINKRIVQKEKDSLKDTIRGTLPAQSGIPLTTPKPSASPKRLKMVPPIYAFDEALTRDTTVDTDTGSPRPTCSYACSGRDAEMDKIFQEASAIAKLLDDDLEPDYSDLPSRQQDEEQKSMYEQLPEPQAPPTEPIQRLVKGSSTAHKIFADVIPPLIEQIKPEAAEGPPYPSQMSNEDRSMGMSVPMPPVPASSQEYGYLDSLFERDRKTANMIKNVSNIVTDAKQDQQSSMSSSPPYDIGPMPSPRSPKTCNDQQSRQPVSQFQQPRSEEGGPSSLTKITQSSTRITTSMPSPSKSPVAPSFGSPSSADDRTFDFAKGYVPPRYMSPTGLGSESPPQFMSPGRGVAPSLRTQKNIPPSTTPQRICPSAQRRLNFGDMDTDTFLAEAMARQDLPPKQISPSVKRKMQFRGMDSDAFLTEAMARQQDLPPLPPDYAPPPQRMQTPPRKGGIPGWESPERALPTTPTFFQSPPASQMLSRENTPPFYDSPKSPTTPPFAAPYSTSPNLFDTSMGDQYSSPPSICTNKSPGMQQTYNRVNTPPFYESPKSQVTPPFVTPDPTSGNLFDTSMGDLYFSPPPASSTMSPGMQQMPNQLSPTQGFRPCRAQKGFNQQSGSDIQQSSGRSPSPAIAGSPSPQDEFGLPPLVQVSPLSKFDQYNQYYERYPDLQSPERRKPSSSGIPPAAGPVKNICPSVRRGLSIHDVDTDTFIAEATARQQNLPPLPPDYPPIDMRTPPRTGWERPWLNGSPFSSPVMLDAINTPPFYDSPNAQLTPPSRNQYFSSPPTSPDMSPGMRQMLDQLPQAQSFLRCKAQTGAVPRNKQSVGSGAKSRRRSASPSAALPTIAGSPPTENQPGLRYPGPGIPAQQTARRQIPQGQNESGYRPCPNSQGSRFAAKGSGQRPSK